MGEFLYGLVRILKPKIIFESGCYLGYVSKALGLAALDNSYGHVFTCDTDGSKISEVKIRTEGLPVTAYHKPALECSELLECDLLFCDSSYESRKVELAKLKEGAFAVVHDTAQEASLQEDIELFKKFMHFSTPRGFSILQVSKTRVDGVSESCNCMHRKPQGGCIIHERGKY